MIQVLSDEARMLELTYDLARRQRSLDRQVFGCCGITLAQGTLLWVLRTRGPQTMGALADQLGVAQSTATRLVEPLRRRGLLRRHRDEEDARTVRVDLTGEGRILADDVLDRGEQNAARVLESIPMEQRPRVLACLETLVGALQCC